jgi:hypothetical protein
MVSSRPAVVRYSATLDATRAAVQEVLAGRSLHVNEVGGDTFMTAPECRTDGGELCARQTAWTAKSTDAKSGGETFGFELAARVVPVDGGAIVRVGARLAKGQGQVMEVGNGEVPAWVQHEVDQVQAEIARVLVPPRPHG